MWGKKRSPAGEPPAAPEEPGRLTQAIRQLRIDVAERSDVVVELRDAELARLELLDEALDPLFGEIPPEVDIFDRGLSQGEPPRLWIDMVAHVVMGRDKRQYRFVQDTRFGRKVLAESTAIEEIVDAVTRYVATRLIERDKALAFDAAPIEDEMRRDVRSIWRHQRWRWLRAFLFGVVMGVVALFGALWVIASRIAHP